MAATLSHDLFRRLLFFWYESNQRSLPWRTTKDPYKIWLSEIILQQTRIAQGLPYYNRFIARYPSLTDLAQATEQEVLRMWQGLGYYSRARNLYHCAQTIQKKYGGIFPTNYQSLLTLKGIGPYTAAAIAAVASKEVVAAVDGNVYRVLARIFGLHEDINSSKGRKVMHNVASQLVDPLQPDTYSQAIMDFGSLQCTPGVPLCSTCPFQPYCVAFHTNSQHILPIKSIKPVKKQRYFDYFIFQGTEKIYMKKRIKGDIWESLYDFHLVENRKKQSIEQMDDPLLALAQQGKKSIYTFHPGIVHLLTHQKLFLTFHKIEIDAPFLSIANKLMDSFGLQPFTIQEIKHLPKPIAIHNFLQKDYRP